MPHVYRRHTPFWKFWNPQSGLFGGLICGAIFLAIYALLSR